MVQFSIETRAMVRYMSASSVAARPNLQLGSKRLRRPHCGLAGSSIAALIGAGVTSAPLGRLDPHDYSRHPLRTVIRCPVRHFDTGSESASWLNGPHGPSGLLYCGAGVGVALIRRFVRPMLSIPGIGDGVKAWRPALACRSNHC